jgi:hypothetical protein
MYQCIVMLRDLEEAKTLTALINKYNTKYKKPVWQGTFWESNFKARQNWGVNIALDGPESINNFSYCDIPWYEDNPPYCYADFLHLEEFIEVLKTGKLESVPDPEPFIRPITIEEVYNGLK